MTEPSHVHVHARGVTIERATLLDIATVAGGRGIVWWRVLREMWRHGQSFAFRDGAGELIAVAGLYPFRPADGEPPDHAEAWFDFVPGAGVHMLGIARLTRLTLAAQTYRRIICHCTSRQGSRFAKLAGFELQGPGKIGELWAR